MPTIPLIARHTFPYANGTVTAGQRFDARSEFDAVVLRAAGHAVDAPVPDDQAATLKAEWKAHFSGEQAPLPKPPRRKRTVDPE